MSWGPWVVDEQILEILVPQQLHRLGERREKHRGHPFREGTHVSIGDEACERLPSVPGHLLVYPTQPLDEPAHVVVPVLVGPDLLDDLPDSLAVGFRRLGGHPGDVTEILKERAVKTIEDDEVRLVWMPLSLPSPRPGHFFKQDRRLHGGKEHRNSRSGMSIPVVSRS